MNQRIDLFKLLKHLLKYSWIILLCGAIGFAGLYGYAKSRHMDTYTASGTMYVNNGNPNLINYEYASTSDLHSAVTLLETYSVVVRSNKVMDVVTEQLAQDYPGITAGFISSTISMSSVAETGVTKVSCTTANPQMAADICNAVMDVAPEEIKRVVGAGSIEVIDYATVPTYPNGESFTRRGMIGALAGATAAAALLILLFLMNHKVADSKELTEQYTPPLLASIQRNEKNNENPADFRINEKTPINVMESYAKLRMNVMYTLVGKKNHVLVVTSAIPGEGKSTITGNLALSCAWSGKHVLLIDGDMRRAAQRDIFQYPKDANGLSEILAGMCTFQKAVLRTINDNLDILPAGRVPPNPADMLSSNVMRELLETLEKDYELILIDMPPINIVSDPLALSDQVAGCLFVVRQNFSDHREVRKALISAELTGMEVLGFTFYGEKTEQDGYGYHKYYHKYYNDYYNRYERDVKKRRA